MTKQASKKKFQPGDVVILVGWEKSGMSPRQLNREFIITGNYESGKYKARHGGIDGWSLHEDEIILNEIYSSPLGQALR